MADFTIRKATKGDCPVIHELIHGLAVYEKLSHEMTGTVENLEENLFGEKAYAEVLICEEDGLSTGFALFFHNFSTFLCKPGMYLEDLFVKPEHRGRGHGLALISAVAKIAEERGCGRVEWSVLDWNEPSIRFYEGLGAKSMDGWTVMRVTGDGIGKLAGASGVGVSD